jgi:hypothetical protein
MLALRAGRVGRGSARDRRAAARDQRPRQHA